MNLKNADIKKLIDFGELTVISKSKDDNSISLLRDKTGKLYYLKISLSQNSWIREILGERIALFLGHPSIHYDRVIIDNSEKEASLIKSAIISESFRKKGSNYIDGMDIIHSYIDSLSDEKLLEYYGTLDRDDIYYRANDLETLWNALEYRYRNRPDKNKIVAKLMNKITDFLNSHF